MHKILSKIHYCFRIFPLVFISLLILLSLSGCSSFREMTEEEKLAYAEWKANQPVYTSETIDATITNIDTTHWFASTHHYKWKVDVYCEQYDLPYSESGYSSGAFGQPSFFDSKIGDIVQVNIQKTFVKNELTNVRVVNVKH